jgi:hypothetical protein
MGIVQNNISVIRISQDLVRAGASLSLLKSRFELSASAGLRRRPAVSVELPDGGTFDFAGTSSADLTMGVLDRRSIAGLRASASATVTAPLDHQLPNRSRGTVGRFALSRTFADERGQIEADVMVERFRDLGGRGLCTTPMSTDVFACYGASRTSAGQVGALASWRLAREWLLLFDAHLGVRSVTANTLAGVTEYPTVYSMTAFARAQWRYR